MLGRGNAEDLQVRAVFVVLGLSCVLMSTFFLFTRRQQVVHYDVAQKYDSHHDW
jgi:hypothetical protein